MRASKEAVQAEADRLIREFGERAYEQAKASIRLAMKRENLHMAAFLAAVAAEITSRKGDVIVGNVLNMPRIGQKPK
jgi:hypothetical protein